MNPLSLIKLSRHINPRAGFTAEPDFARDLWTTMLNQSFVIEDVFLFCNSRWLGKRTLFESGARVTPRIASLGRMAQLKDKELVELKSRSSENGHLSVLYQIAYQELLVANLINLFTATKTLSDARRDDLALKSDETLELNCFIEARDESHLFAGFAHNAEPLYLFGHPTLLEASLQLAADLAV